MKYRDKIIISYSNTLALCYRLAKYGDIYPIGKSTGQVNVAGRSWDLWIGYNGAMRVYSFIAPSPVKNFNADVKEFFRYLQNSQNYPASQQNLIGEFQEAGLSKEAVHSL